MPADVLPPVADDLLTASAAGVVSKHDVADTHDGSRYDVWNGVAAVLFARVAERARGNFRNVYFDTATEAALDGIVAKRYTESEPRTVATSGVGKATLVRANTSAGAGTLYEGTRIALSGVGATEIKFYAIATDWPVSSTDLKVTPDIKAYVPGTGQAASANSVDDRMHIEDAIFDPSFLVLNLTCADGLNRELNSELQTRVRAERTANRPGYEAFIVKTMKSAGADVVKLFASNFFGDSSDHGLNRIYVSDAGFHTSTTLLNACRLAAFDCVTLGMAPQVLPLTSSAFSVQLTLTLWNPLSQTSRDGLIADVRGRVIDYINTNPFVWQLDTIVGAARGSASDISDISVIASVAQPNISTLFDVAPLTRWTLSDNDCTVVFA